MPCEKNVRKKLLENIDRNKDEIFKFLENLVKIPSVSGTPEEGKAQKVVIKEFGKIRDLILDVWEPNEQDIQKYPLSPVRLTDWSFKDRPNVVGTLRGTGGGKSLILNGHIDIVSPEPLKAWNYNPWGEMVNGRLYGRGSMDMKAGIAAMTYALKCIQDTGLELKGDVILESVVEEEIGSGGIIATLLRNYTADAAIVCEPSSSDSICIGAGGSRWFRVNVEGRPEWPHLAHLGVNAIGLAMKIYNALVDLDRRRGDRLRGKHPLFETLKSGGMKGPGRCTNMTVGILRAGDWPAIVAGTAELVARIGFPPSERGVDVIKEINKTIENVAKSDNWMRVHPPKIEWFGSRKEGYELNPKTPIVKTLRKNVEKISGRSELFALSSAADSNHLTVRIDSHGGIPSVWYGPGGGQAHAVDEYVELEQIINVCKTLSLTILDWCQVNM